MTETTPETLLADTRAALTTARSELEALLAVKGPRSEADTLGPYQRLQLALSNAGHRAGLLSEVHPEKPLRDAAESAVQEISAYATELSLHRGLYEALASVKADGLAPDTRRFLEHTLRDFRRAGVDKDEPTRTRLKELADRAVRLGQDFDRAIREDVRSVSLRPEQLAGLPDDYRATHRPGPDGKVGITTDYPDLLPFRTYADDGEARRQLYVENTSRAYPGNEKVLREILEVRAEQARLLGMASWADYVTEDKMSKSGKTRGRVPRPGGGGERGPGEARRGAAAPAQAEGRARRDAGRGLGEGVLRGAGEAGGAGLRLAVGAALLRVRPGARRAARPSPRGSSASATSR